MLVTPYKSPLVRPGDDLFEVLAQTLPTKIDEETVVVVTSKVVALCEGRVFDKNQKKHELVKQEAEWYLPSEHSRYNLMITIKDQVVAVNAGIDESNVNGMYVALPSDSYKSAEQIWAWLREHFSVVKCGVLIVDSKTIPLKWGTIGTCLAHCGFSAITDKIGSPDLYGRPLQMTKVNVAEALAVAGVLSMGEANESQPVCLITDIPQIQWQTNPPTAQERSDLHIELSDDAYAPLLTSVAWQKGGNNAQ
jgi:putative folate metabolism gamma-glutamate ligase